MQIGPYRILERLGDGGMGSVFLAEQMRPVRRRVAVKVIRPGMESKDVLARFESERQALALMNHPGIARILDVGTTDEARPYFVMEYVPGPALTAYCDRERLGVEARLALFLDLCAAIGHAHQRGILHRDIKPSNVLVAEEGGRPVVKVIDFGIAKATREPLTDLSLHTRLGSLLGTPEYMSPEQAELSPLEVDTRTDVYSLGAVLYELLVGLPPLPVGECASLAEVQRIIREQDPVPPSRRLVPRQPAAEEAALKRASDGAALRRRLAGDLDWIVLKALEKDRSRRYAFAAELAADLRRHLEDRPVLAGPPSAAYRLGKFGRRHRGGLVAAALALAVLAVGLWGLAGWRHAARAAELAQRFGQDVAGLEWQLRVAQMSPLHDMTGDRRRIEAQLEAVAERTRRLGRAARPAGEYALGRGELALGRDAEALAHLDAAWQAGLRSPELAYARGVALGRIFNREAKRARAAANPKRREELLAAAERRYRDPALAALAGARSTAAAPLPYIEALIAYYEERYDEAFGFLDAALAEAPWLWEAHRLRGDALIQLAAQRYRENDREEGARLSAEADRAFAAAVALAPSAGDAYHGRCSNGVYRLFQTLNEGVTEAEFEAIRAAAESSCRNLRAVLPDHPELRVDLANIHLMTGRRQVAQGKDPRAELEQSRALAAEAAERDPASASVLRALGDAVLGLGRYGWERGDDVRTLLAEAGATFERAARIEESTAALNNAANAYLLKGRLERDRGVDPSPDLSRAEALYHRAAEVSPTDVLTYGNLTLVAKDLGEWEAAHGVDPRPRLRAAVERLGAHLVRAPDHPFLNTVMAGACALLAQTEAAWGGPDPGAWIDRGRQAAARAVARMPGATGPLWDLAQVEREAVREAVRQAADPGPAAAAALAALDRFDGLAPGLAKSRRLRGEVHLELARDDRRRGRSAEANLRAARAELEAALALEPAQQGRHVFPHLADALLLELEDAGGAAAPRRYVGAAADLARRIEAAAGGEADCLLAAARLLRWESLASLATEERQEAARRAEALEVRAVAINPTLARR